MVFTKENISDIYTLTPMQEGMYYFYKLDSESKAYFQQSSIRFKGELNLTTVQESLNILVERHDILRTVFVENLADRLLQVVLKKRGIDFEFKDFSGTENIDEQLVKFRREIRDVPFNLNRDVLLRLSIVKIAEKSFELIWSFHHIILDGWCAAIAINEFFEIYRSLIKHKPLNLPKPVQFKNYIAWLGKQNIDNSLKYWKDYFNGFEQFTSFRSDRSANNTGYTKEDHLEIIQKSLLERLQILAIKNQVTLYTVFQTVWGLLLARYNDTQDVVFGTVVSGRPSQVEGVDKILGMFINTMPVRITFEEEQSFSELLKLSQSSSFRSQEHHYAGLADIQKQSMLGGNLFDHIIAFENLPTVSGDTISDLKEDGFHIEFYLGGAEGQTNFDLDISFIPGPEFLFQLSYNSNVYKGSYVKNIAKHFIHLLNQVVTNNDIRLKDIHLINEEEQSKILGFNPPLQNSAASNIIGLFKDNITLFENRPAVKCNADSVTYGELDRMSDRVAACLIHDHKTEKGHRIGIHVSRSENLIILLLAVLKSGAAYVPIEPDLPPGRIAKMIEASGVSIVISDFPENLLQIPEIMLLETDELLKKSQTYSEYPLSPLPDDLAYILFTSGSTGEPKGVMVEHHSLTDYALACKKYFSITHEDRVISQSSIAFDTLIEELFPALLAGACVIIVPEGGKDIQTILNLIENDHITILSTTPLVIAELNKYPETLKKLRILISGGDKLKPSYISDLIGKTTIYNTYGPTETTVCATYHPVTSLENAHIIGKPIENRQVYILDHNRHMVPVGIEGEIFIGGTGVARGYLEKKQDIGAFIPDPFYPDKTVYRTGDRARWREDGSIEFIDRTDNQVKIRGYRIELQEIEACIESFDGIKNVHVLPRDKNNIQYLCAYFTAISTISLSELRDHLSDQLPCYMMPAEFIQLEELPLLSNGKIDLKALPAPEETADQEENNDPQNVLEAYLEEIWAEVLGCEKVGTHDNFFSIGGDSIKSIQIQAKLKKKGYKFELRDLFRYPTISGLAGKVSKLNRIPVQTTIKGNIPLTPIQRSFFELQKTARHHYNHAILITLEQGFDLQGIKVVFQKLGMHHDALRIVFSEQNGKIVQKNCGPELLPEIHEYDLSADPDAKTALQNEMDTLHTSFNLETGPLIKVALFHLPDGDRLFITVHHLIMDGVSWRILLEDFENLYHQYVHKKELDLPAKTDSYKLWAESLISYSTSKKVLREIPYWEKTANKTPDNIPYDHEGTSCIAEYLDHASITCSADQTSLLTGTINNVYSTHVKDILLCALGLAFHKTFGIKTLLLSMEGHGREQITGDLDLSRTIGWFTSQFPVVIELSEPDDLSYTIRNVKESIHRIPMNGIGYSILKYLSPKESVKLKFDSSPVVEFNYLGQFNTDIQGDYIQNITEQPGKLISDQTEFDKDLIITAIVPDDTLTISIEYNRTRFSESTIHNLLERYKESLNTIINHCKQVNEKILTPSDLSDDDLTLDELDEIHSLVDNI